MHGTPLNFRTIFFNQKLKYSYQKLNILMEITVKENSKSVVAEPIV